MEDYKMSIHIFGKMYSPCIVNWVVKKAGKDQTKNYSKRAI